jgi:hypothetical protein
MELKTNEFQIGSTKDFKARNLFNPRPEVKAVCGWYNSICLDYLRTLFPESMVGCDGDQMCDRILNAYQSIDDPVFFCFDGSNHDAHQHSSLIASVDGQFHEFMRQLLPDLNIDDHEAFCDAASFCSLLSAQISCKVRKGHLMEKWLSGELVGTTFTGHPTSTTLGNTLRVISYCHLLCELSSIPSAAYKVFVSGDDSIIVVSKKYLQTLETNFRSMWTHVLDTPQETTQQGLGQLYKDY